MKYSIHIDQKRITDLGYDLDFIDAAIIDVIHGMFASPGITKKIEHNVLYIMIRPSFLVKELPLLKMKEDSAYRRLKILVNKGFVKACESNSAAKESWYCSTKKLSAIYSNIGRKSDVSDTVPISSDVNPISSDTVPIKPIGYSSDNNSIKDLDKGTIDKGTIDKPIATATASNAGANSQDSSTPKPPDNQTPLNPHSAPPLLPEEMEKNKISEGDGRLRKMCGDFYRKHPNKYPVSMYGPFLKKWTALVQDSDKPRHIGKELWETQSTWNIETRLDNWREVDLKKENQSNESATPKNGHKHNGATTGNRSNGSATGHSKPLKRVPNIPPHKLHREG